MELCHADLQLVGRVEDFLRIAIGELHLLALIKVRCIIDAAVRRIAPRMACERQPVAMEEQWERQHARQDVFVRPEAEIRLVDLDGRTMVDFLDRERVLHPRDLHRTAERLPAEARMHGNGELPACERQDEQSARARVLRIKEEAAAWLIFRDAAKDFHIFRHARERIKHRLEVEPLARCDQADSAQMFLRPEKRRELSSHGLGCVRTEIIELHVCHAVLEEQERDNRLFPLRMAVRNRLRRHDARDLRLRHPMLDRTAQLEQQRQIRLRPAERHEHRARTAHPALRIPHEIQHGQEFFCVAHCERKLFHFYYFTSNPFKSNSIWLSS